MTSVTQSGSNFQQCFAKAFVLYGPARYIDRHAGFVASHDRLDGAATHDEVKFDNQAKIFAERHRLEGIRPIGEPRQRLIVMHCSRSEVDDWLIDDREPSVSQ